MKTLSFIFIIIISGAFAGTIHGLTNLVIIEPVLDNAIGLENQNLFETGQEKDTPEFWANYYSYRDWQKGGQILAGAILGISMGSLFGIIFAYSKGSFPFKNNIKKTLVLAGIFWLTIFFIPFLKYPSNPPTVGDPDTVVLREILFLAFVAISGLAALGFYKISKRIQKKTIPIGGYILLITIAFFLMPENPDSISAPMQLVSEFRILSVFGVSIFWASLGIILGLLWNKFQPDKKTEKQIH